MAENSLTGILAGDAGLLKVPETIRVPALGDGRRCAWRNRARVWKKDGTGHGYHVREKGG